MHPLNLYGQNEINRQFLQNGIINEMNFIFYLIVFMECLKEINSDIENNSIY